MFKSNKNSELHFILLGPSYLAKLNNLENKGIYVSAANGT